MSRIKCARSISLLIAMASIKAKLSEQIKTKSKASQKSAQKPRNIVTSAETPHTRWMTVTELSEKVDIELINLSILKLAYAIAVRFSTLEAFCAALQCQPGDLLAVEEGAKDA